MTKSALKRLTERPREIGHGREVGDTSPVDPAEDLARVEGAAPARLEQGRQLGRLQLGKIGTRETTVS